jgi:hypothetical protein
MRVELWLILITGGILFHMYTDGKYTKNVMMYKKQFQMGGVVFGAFVLYVLIKKNPANAQNILVTSNEYLKYLHQNIVFKMEEEITMSCKYQTGKYDKKNVSCILVKKARSDPLVKPRKSLLRPDRIGNAENAMNN